MLYAARSMLWSLCCLSVAASAAAGQCETPALLPLELAAIKPAGFELRNVGFTADGSAIAFTQLAGELIEPGSTGTGVPPQRGQRSRVTVVDTRTGEHLFAADPESWSWGEQWSPDGTTLAFYSDASGQVRVWLWQKGASIAKPIEALAPRPTSRSTEPVFWTRDGRSIVVRVQAGTADSSSPPAAAAKQRGAAPAVKVLTSPPTVDATATAPRATRTDTEVIEYELRTGKRRVIAADVQVRWFDLSPDNNFISYARRSASAAATDTSDLMVYDRRQGSAKLLAANLSLLPSGCTWAPDSRSLACIQYRTDPANRSLTRHDLSIVAVSSGVVRAAATNLTTMSAVSAGQPPRPIWGADSRSLYVVGTDESPTLPAKWYTDAKQDTLWKVDVTGEQARELVHLAEGEDVTGVVSADGRAVWSGGKARSAWILVKDSKMRRGLKALTSLYEVDLASGDTRLRQSVSAGWVTSAGAAATAPTMGFVADSIASPADFWLVNVTENSSRRLTHLNPQWECQELGVARLLEYQDRNGETLRSGVLLPPRYKEGTRLPLIVSVYGHANDSTNIGNLGIHGTNASNNMQVFATRGYAVMVPDMPLRQGHQLQDVVGTVTDAIDAAVGAGLADPERVGVIGYSLGAYFALGAGAMTDRFKAVSMSGVTLFPDLIGDYLGGSYPRSTSSPTFYDDVAFALSLGGNPWTQRDRFVANSIATYFDRLHTPVHMVQGTGDGLYSSNAIFGALTALRKDVEYRIYDGEDHAISRPLNVIDLWQSRLKFFDDKLRIARDAEGRMQYEGASETAVRAPVSPSR